MARVCGQVFIEAPPDVVFDLVADSRNEPLYNPDMREVHLLTEPPIGPGTRFQATMGKADTEMLVELTYVDRPHRLGSRTVSSLMTTEGALTFDPAAGGTLLAWDWQVQPHGRLRLLGPLMGRLAGRFERRIWTGLKHHIEDGAGRPA